MYFGAAGMIRLHDALQREDCMTTVFVVWNDSRATGIPLIDEQHRNILSAMNALFHVMRKNDGAKPLVPLVTTLEQHMHHHFMTEENLLRETQYAGVEEHARCHEELLKKMKALSARLRHSGNADDLLSFLKTWWKDHIEVQDRAYTGYVISHLRERYAVEPAAAGRDAVLSPAFA